MALIKKKKPREIKDDDPLFVKLWFNERSHAAIVLGLYFLFFAIIIIIINLSGSTSKTKNEITGSSINSIFESINNKDITYNYVITNGNKTYYFSGENKDDGIYGTMLHNGESVNIRVLDSQCAVGDYIDGEFKGEYSLCPENINYEYFDYKNIQKLISNKKGKNYSSNGYYDFNLDNKTNLKIYYNNNVLKKISIEGSSSYELKFDEKEVKTEENNQ